MKYSYLEIRLFKNKYLFKPFPYVQSILIDHGFQQCVIPTTAILLYIQGVTFIQVY